MIPYARTGWGTFSISLVQETLRSTRFHPIIKPEGCTYVLNRNQVPSDVIELHDEQQFNPRYHVFTRMGDEIHSVPFAVVRSFYFIKIVNTKIINTPTDPRSKRWIRRKTGRDGYITIRMGYTQCCCGIYGEG